MKYGAIAIAYYLYLAFFETAQAVFDFWIIVDKYGYPTALSFLLVMFVWNRQKIADAERNGLIALNNDLIAKLIDAIKSGNHCKFVTNNGEQKNVGQ